MSNSIIHLTGEITVDKVSRFKQLCLNAINEEKPDTLSIFLTSQGGSVKACIAIYEFLSLLQEQIIMYNVGYVDSSALIIYLAGDIRYALPHSSFLIHELSKHYIAGDIRFSHFVNDYRSLKSDISVFENILRKHIKNNANALEVLNYLSCGEVSFGSSEAFEYGITTAMLANAGTVAEPPATSSIPCKRFHYYT